MRANRKAYASWPAVTLVAETDVEIIEGPPIPLCDARQPEISMLARHLLESALVHVNALLLERVLADGDPMVRLDHADRRGLTALF